MKLFWITYAVGTVALLGFCFSFLEVLPLCVAMTVAAGLSTLLLVRKRAALMRQKHLFPVALMASVASVASGFILILVGGLIWDAIR
jgi:nitric oxide reductase large subunit